MQLSFMDCPKPISEVQIVTSDTCATYCSDIASADREVFIVLHLNTRNQVLDCEIVAIGALNSAVISIRETFRRACVNSSAAIITVHNHPSGSLEPSPEDIALWCKLDQASAVLDIPILDHLIISRAGVYSHRA